MVKDRLNEFRAGAGITGTTIDDDEEDDDKAQVSYKGLFKPKEKKPDESLGNIFKDADDINENLISLRKKIAEVKKLHANIISSPQVNELPRKSLELKDAEIRTLSQVIQKQLKDLSHKVEEDKKENEETRKKGSGDTHQADLRIRTLQHSVWLDKYKNLMREYNESQVHYQEQTKKLMKRALEIVNRDMTEEEIDEALESNSNIQIFTDKHLANTQKAKDDLREVEERHQELLKLEKSIQQVRDLFHDTAVFVAEQGEQIDRIDLNILEAKDYVESAVTQTQKAIVSRKKSRKKRLCLIGCISILVAFLVVAISLSVIFR